MEIFLVILFLFSLAAGRIMVGFLADLFARKPKGGDPY